MWTDIAMKKTYAILAMLNLNYWCDDEELKGKLCGLYSEKDKSQLSINQMGSVKIDGKNLLINVGENLEIKDD